MHTNITQYTGLEHHLRLPTQRYNNRGLHFYPLGIHFVTVLSLTSHAKVYFLLLLISARRSLIQVCSLIHTALFLS